MKSILPSLESPVAHQPAIILVEPQISQNIGAVARAMLNFGLTDLRLVGPSKNWLNKDAAALAAGASPLLEQTKVFETTRDALHDVQISFATTARVRDMVKPAYTPQKAVDHTLSLIQAQSRKAAFLFGREKCGLSNEDLSLVEGTVHIPINPEFASLNLAQAVIVLSYEWTRQLESFVPQSQEIILDVGNSRPATGEEVFNFFEHLEKELEESNFLKLPGKKEIMKRNIRNMFQRADLTEQEIRTLHGIVTYLVRLSPEKSRQKNRHTPEKV
ncbi:MAG: RNA methyltransferase [bacterium]|nr:RNA methyltransferase [bacterium]